VGIPARAPPSARWCLSFKCLAVPGPTRSISAGSRKLRSGRTGTPAPTGVLGFGGNDHLIGGSGHDTLNGGDGVNVVEGGAGTDYLQFFGTTGPDTVTVGPGNGTLSTPAETDNYSSIEQFQLSGQGGNDSLTASGARDFLTGGDGVDTLMGGGDGDVFVGSAGNDTIQGGDGNDFAEGGPGNDTLNGGAGSDGLTGNEDSDTLEGGDGPDTLDGGAGDDTLRGGPAGDKLNVSAGNDALDGQDGPDTHVVVFGGLGTVGVADTGGSGSDSLEIVNCPGVTVTTTRASRGPEVVNYSGIEVAPCGFGQPPPPAPPSPPPPAPPPARPRSTPRCVVPNVKGKTLAAARKSIAQRRCRVGKITRVHSRRFKKGRVVGQRPAGGRRMPRGSRVHLTVSRGPKRR
jgi:Ca2+-binding RTX toxin-like protein